MMNKVYRVVWNRSLGMWQAVSECARGKGKAGKSQAVKRLLLTWFYGALITPAFAQLPTGGEVVAGQGSIAQHGDTMTVNQNSDKLAIDWQSFNIGQNNQVNFVQPNSQSVALNQVLGSDVSVIQGALNANGQIFLLNPNGVLFTPSAQVDVGGLVATTLTMSKDDFLAGRYALRGNSHQSVINQGQINAKGSDGQNGVIALVAAQVINQGELTARYGDIALTAANEVLLDLGGPLKLKVHQGAVDALVDQGGAIRADGGTIYLTAHAANTLASSVINSDGLLQADTLGTNDQGRIILSSSGSVNLSGTVQTSGLNGGSISIDAPDIALSAANLDASGNNDGGSIKVLALKQTSDQDGVAHQINVAADVTLNASSIQNGNGGVIDVISELTDVNGLSRVAGTLKSKGGASHGDGGQIEVSGYKVDLAGIRIDALAPNGEAGDFLIDPYDITISTAADNATSAGFTATGPGATINTTTLQNALAGANVTVFTSNSGTESGNITVSSPITWSANTRLTLDAANGVIVNSNITNTGTGSALTFRARGAGGISGTGHLDNAGTLTFFQQNALANSQYAGSIAGSGGVDKLGLGLLNLLGSNSYSGATTILGGVLQVGSSTALGVDSTVRVNGGARLDLNGFDLTLGALLGGGLVTNSTSNSVNLTVGSSNSQTAFVGVIEDGAGQVHLTKVGSGRINLTGVNTYTGTTTIDEGFINIGGANGTTANTGSIVVNSGGVLVFNRSDTWGRHNTLQTAAITINSGGRVQSNGNFNQLWNLTLNGGTLNANGGANADYGAFGLSGTVTVTGNSFIVTSGDHGKINLGGNGNLTTTFNVVGASDSLNVAAALKNFDVFNTASSLTKTGAGTLALAGANTYTGTTTVGAGTLVLNQSTRSSAVTVDAGAMLQFGNSNSDYLFNSAVSSINGSGTFQKIGSNLVRFGGANTFTWNMGAGGLIDVQQGTLKGSDFNRAVWTDNLASLNVEQGATFNGVEGNVRVDALTGAGVISSGFNPAGTAYKNFTFGVNNGSGVFNGIIQNGNFAGNFVKLGTGTQVLAGANTYTGTTTVQAGVLTLDGSWSVGADTANVLVEQGGILNGLGTLTAGELLIGGLGTVSLTGNNQVGSVSGSSALGSLTFNNNQSLRVGSMSAAGPVLITTSGLGADLTLNADSVLSSASGGDAITLVAGRHFINQSNGAALSVPNGRWLVYSDNPAASMSGGLSGFKRYNLSYSANSSNSISQTGNGFVYNIAPVLTVVANNKTKEYGESNPLLDGSFSGLIDGDTVGDAIDGDVTFSTIANNSSGVGSYTIAADLDALVSSMGYQINTQSGTLRIDPRAITLVADDVGKVYGEADPNLTYRISNGSLVNGDVLNGSLSREAGENVGVYTIDASSLQNSNYAVTTQNGTLRIDPRAIAVAVDAKTKTLGEIDPELTYRIISGDLVNGDVLRGSLSRIAGENVGTYGIDASGLQNSNYLITTENNILNIVAPPLAAASEARQTLGAASECELSVCKLNESASRLPTRLRLHINAAQTPHDEVMLKFDGSSIILDYMPTIENVTVVDLNQTNE